MDAQVDHSHPGHVKVAADLEAQVKNAALQEGRASLPLRWIQLQEGGSRTDTAQLLEQGQQFGLPAPAIDLLLDPKVLTEFAQQPQGRAGAADKKFSMLTPHRDPEAFGQGPVAPAHRALRKPQQFGGVLGGTKGEHPIKNQEVMEDIFNF